MSSIQNKILKIMKKILDNDFFENFWRFKSKLLNKKIKDNK